MHFKSLRLARFDEDSTFGLSSVLGSMISGFKMSTFGTVVFYKRIILCQLLPPIVIIITTHCPLMC